MQKRYEDAERIRQELERRSDDRELLDRKELLEKEISELKRKAGIWRRKARTSKRRT
ncbi:hypothetical protein [Cohnella faecalis]|uniref:hypothetical protein n=1 Tax=Cohnella faecalis TaxID=2315694 RepID=UPI001314145C|nr:hypothetical protein [Cohnella faecalis]